LSSTSRQNLPPRSAISIHDLQGTVFPSTSTSADFGTAFIGIYRHSENERLQANATVMNLKFKLHSLAGLLSVRAPAFLQRSKTVNLGSLFHFG
jgi:hypothetical protein